MKPIEKIISEFSVLDPTSQTVKNAIESTILADNLDVKGKIKSLIRELIESRKVQEKLLPLVDEIDDSELVALLPSVEVDDDESVSVEHELSKEEVAALDDVASAEYDPSKLLTAGNSYSLPIDIQDKLELDDIDESDIIVVAHLMDIDRFKAKQYILKCMTSNEYDENFSYDEVETLVNDIIWDKCTIENGFYAMDGETKIDLFDYFKQIGFDDDAAKRESMHEVRKSIIAKLDEKSRKFEYAFEKFDHANLANNNDEMEISGSTLVPKRKVKYDYAVATDDRILKIEDTSKLTPHREFAPYKPDRCKTAIEMIRDKVSESGLDLRLKMELSFYEFKLSQAEFSNKYSTNTMQEPWSNSLTDKEEYVQKAFFHRNQALYHSDRIDKIKSKTLSSPLNVVKDSLYMIELNTMFEKYYIFKEIEFEYNEYLQTLNHKES